ncbi:MAG: hypothetical protein Q4A92_01405 [Corynebacterium sp.]|nr:hypothetical protein [Corynebacterium sp.]
MSETTKFEGTKNTDGYTPPAMLNLTNTEEEQTGVGVAIVAGAGWAIGIAAVWAWVA